MAEGLPPTLFVDPDSAEEGPMGKPAYRPPKQRRSQQTLERIVEAALGLMEEVGVEGATVAAIVERAGASVGSFYARFSGKDELVRYLQAGIWTTSLEKWDQALASRTWEGLSMASVVEGVVGILFRSLSADYRRRMALGRDRAESPEAAEPVLAFHDHLLSTVTPLLLARRGEISHPEPEAAIGFGYRVVVGAIREFIEIEQARGSLGEAGAGSAMLAELGPELARLWTGYLRPTVATDGGAEDGEVDFFDPWG